MENRLASDILNQAEADAYTQRAVMSKFKQQMLYGVGAAMVFGLFTALASALVHSLPAIAEMSLSFATVGPLMGLAAVGALGVFCLYNSAKYLSENTLRDQALQAKQMAAASRGPVQDVAVVMPTPAAAPAFPEKADALDAAPEKRWTDALASKDAAASWVAKSQAARAEPETARA